MPPQLLPASAAAFAPRASSVNVVLGSKIEPWLTQTLKRINRVKRPLNSVAQHQRCLTETLSSANALWTLASLMVTKAPESDLRQDANPLVEAISNYQLITVEAYIVHVDMVLRNEVAFKLTPESIEALIDYHKDIHCADAKANTYDWSEKEQQCKKLHNDFIQAVNKYVFRTHVSALEGLEEDGAGELLCGKSEEVKTNILGMFKPLLPPPPKPVDGMHGEMHHNMHHDMHHDMHQEMHHEMHPDMHHHEMQQMHHTPSPPLPYTQPVGYGNNFGWDRYHEYTMI
ncbi:hypothetical protein F503_06694 [Ophiostoma piceae UAMH 11346]|uniref:Uncharacterized protein n=1 Tax=Ophiostoma piceae (strain UAMH 11346) TaxID=1262450 RepID=S3BVR7_OPHP1|nr:hypothetical protein F503_06694 [Ophiostoma piceae UAMH 11346]